MRIVRRRWQHLLWTVPLALLLSYPLWIWAGINWCGVSGCSGGGFGIVRDGESTSWVSLGISAALILGATGLVPWLKPWWVRVLVALVLAAAFFVAGIYFTGGPTPAEGQSGGWMQ